jgi:hypothetical protein
MNNNRFSFTRISSNIKTGPIPVTMTDKASCPGACALKGTGCYAESGNVNLHWQRLSDPSKGYSLQEFLGFVSALPKGQLWRHNVAGDLPSDDRGYIDAVFIQGITEANTGRKGFTYTHNAVTGKSSAAKANRALIKWANAYGFTINLSANNLDEADELQSLNIGPVVTLLPEWKEGDAKVTYTPAGKPVVVCPAVTTEGVNCAMCKLCANPDRSSIVGFPVHGVRKKAAMKVFSIKAV